MTGTVRIRRLRHRELDGLARDRLDHNKDDIEAFGNAPGRPDQDFTIANATNIATINGHGHATGDGPFFVTNSGGALPTGLEAGVRYWLNVIDANTFTFHPTKADAAADTNVVAVSDDGTGTHTLHTP